MSPTSRWSLVATGLATLALAVLAVGSTVGASAGTSDVAGPRVTCCSG